MPDMLWFDMLRHMVLSLRRITTNSALPYICTFVFSHRACQVLLTIIENVSIRVWRNISIGFLLHSSISRPLRVLYTSSVTVQFNQPTMLHKTVFKRSQWYQLTLHFFHHQEFWKILIWSRHSDIESWTCCDWFYGNFAHKSKIFYCHKFLKSLGVIPPC